MTVCTDILVEHAASNFTMTLKIKLACFSEIVVLIYRKLHAITFTILSHKNFTSCYKKSLVRTCVVHGKQNAFIDKNIDFTYMFIGEIKS
jgi:hypothetical protein